jgi:hypothetical protein
MAEHTGKAAPGEIPPERTEPAAQTPSAGAPAVETPAVETPGPGTPRQETSRQAIPAAGTGPGDVRLPAAVPAARLLPRQETITGPAAAEQAPGTAAAREVPAPEPAAARPEPGPGQRARQPGQAAPARTRESKRWELIIAVSIALVTVTGAALTYLSIQQEAAAVEADRQSVVETLQVQNQVVSAATEARAYGILAARYRQLMAEASVLAGTDPEQAAMLRADAVGFALNGVTQYTTGTGAAAQYNFAAALQGALTVAQSSTIPADQPARTAALAEQHRQVAASVALSVVGLLGVVVLLTLARVVTAERLKRGLLGAAAAGYLAAVIAAVVQLA